MCELHKVTTFLCEFRIVRYSEVNPANYYTLSKYGVMYVQKCTAEFTSMLEFEKEMLLYDRVRSVSSTRIPLNSSFILLHGNLYTYTR